MKIERMNKGSWGKVRAFFDLTTQEGFTIKGFKIIDGINGLVIINPTDQTLFEYGQLEKKQEDLYARLAEIKDAPAVTLDGVHVTLSANVEQISDAAAVLEC